MILTEGFRLVLAGIGLGFLATLALMKLISSQLYGVTHAIHELDPRDRALGNNLIVSLLDGRASRPTRRSVHCPAGRLTTPSTTATTGSLARALLAGAQRIFSAKDAAFISPESNAQGFMRPQPPALQT
jgi:hypothetical protein